MVCNSSPEPEREIIDIHHGLKYNKIKVVVIMLVLRRDLE